MPRPDFWPVSRCPAHRWKAKPPMQPGFVTPANLIANGRTLTKSSEQTSGEWAAPALGENFSNGQPLFYMFSGPDFLYANAFFPNAATYILCGTEPIGPIPEVNDLSGSELNSALTNLRASLESSLNWSFFITKHMKADLKHAQLSGTLPVLFVFLARAGYTIDSVTMLKLDESGQLTDSARRSTSGVKIVFSGPAGSEQTLYYFTTDLADWSVNVNPGFSEVLPGTGSRSQSAQSCFLPFASESFRTSARFFAEQQRRDPAG